MEQAKICLLVYTEFSDGYGHVKGHFVVQDGSSVKGVDMGSPCSDLYISNQMSEGDTDRDETFSYGWSTEYRSIHSIDLKDAERIVKTLRSIEKKLHNLEKQRGRCNSFGEYTGRVCEALNVTEIYFYTHKAQSCKYADSEYRLRPLGEGINEINWMVVQANRKLRGKE